MKQEIKETTKSVGIWIRVSTEDQARGESPEHHEMRARYYAEAKGWNIKEVYHLEALSGKDVMNYPETKRMLVDIGSGHITGLIFSKLARLARNTRQLLDFADIFREQNADLISLQESIDTSTPSGRLFYTVIAAMAQWEREEISDRVKASVPVRARLGKKLGGQAMFGYKWVDNDLVPDEKEAPVLRLLFELFLEQHRKKTVAKILNERGHRTRNGSKFSDATVTRLLKDPTSKGIHRMNYTKSLGGNRSWELKSEDNWIMRPVPPAVSEELWNACNAILTEQEKKIAKPTKKAIHLFIGFAYCHCGGRMFVPSNSPKYTCRICRNKIDEADLETIFQEQLKAFVFSPEEIYKAFDQTDKIIKEKAELIVSNEKESKKLAADMDKIMQLYIDGELPKEGFGRRYNPLDERKKQIDDQIPELQGELDFLRIQLLSKDEILTETKDLYSNWKDLKRESKRKIIETITDKIIINSDEIHIHLNYIPSPSKLTAFGQHNHRDS